MREAIAKALYEHRSAKAAADLEAVRKAYGPNVGTGVLPYQMVEADHLEEADVVIDAIVAAIGWPEIKAYQEELAKGQDVWLRGRMFARMAAAILPEPSARYSGARAVRSRPIRKPPNVCLESNRARYPR